MSVPLALAQRRVDLAAARYQEARRQLRYTRGWAGASSPWGSQQEYARARVELQEATKALNTARRRAR